MNRKWLLLSGAFVVMLSAEAFETTARIFPADSRHTIEVWPENEDEKAAISQLAVDYIREDGRGQKDESRYNNQALEPIAFRTSPNGSLLIDLELRGEYEHLLRFSAPDANGKLKQLDEIRLLSLHDDLFALRPWKGDWHTHSEKSDGKYEPAKVAAYGRRAGYDFMSLTDHRKHAPSVEAQQVIAPWQSGMKLYTGEEFHTADSVLHSLSIGASAGVNDWAKNHPEEFNRATEALLADDLFQNQNDFPDPDRRDAAEAQVLYAKAHELGALVIYCHPYWRPNGRYNAPTRFNEFMIANAPFDAIEMPNGGSAEAMMMTAAQRYDAALKGRRLNPVGVSDTHDAANASLGDFHTVVFAPTPEFADIAQAVRAGYSVAAFIENAKQPFYHGQYRPVKVAYFLNKDFWPKHDALCKKQGELLLQAADGKPDLAAIDALREELDQLRKSYWSE